MVEASGQKMLDAVKAPKTSRTITANCLTVAVDSALAKYCVVALVNLNGSAREGAEQSRVFGRMSQKVYLLPIQNSACIPVAKSV
jgi:hypothetical protein